MMDSMKLLMLLLFTVLISPSYSFAGGGHGHHGHGHDDHHENEGKTSIMPEYLEKSGVKVEKAGSKEIVRTIRLNGRLEANGDRLAHITPRFDGVVVKVKKELGDSVEAGDVLAVVESNESLHRYNVKSLISGVVVSKHISVGEFVRTDSDVFVVADLNTLWADFALFPSQYKEVEVGQKITIRPADSRGKLAVAKVSYVSSFSDPHTQAKLVRVELDNSDGKLNSGLFVAGDVVVDSFLADVAVHKSAIQTVEHHKVVFVRNGNEFEAKPVKLGKSNKGWVEVKSGLKAGQEYVSKNSFIVKADMFKHGATHSH